MSQKVNTLVQSKHMCTHTNWERLTQAHTRVRWASQSWCLVLLVTVATHGVSELWEIGACGTLQRKSCQTRKLTVQQTLLVSEMLFDTERALHCGRQCLLGTNQDTDFVFGGSETESLLIVFFSDIVLSLQGICFTLLRDLFHKTAFLCVTINYISEWYDNG